MADRAQEILDGCEHEPWSHGGVCRPCADRAVEVAREEIREVIRRQVDGPMREALLADIEDSRRST